MTKKRWRFVIACCAVLMVAPIGEVFGAPVADAGPDQVVIEKVTLDGSQSFDEEGMIEKYDWLLVHNVNTAYNRTGVGIEPVISDLEPGFYTVVLTVTSRSESDPFTTVTNSDVMTLAVAGGPKPSISNVSPADVLPGDTVTISGDNFGEPDEGELTPADSFVYMGKKPLEITSWQNGSIEATVKSFKCQWFDGEPAKEKKIYVKIGSVESNKKKLTINQPEDCLTAP